MQLSESIQIKSIFFLPNYRKHLQKYTNTYRNYKKLNLTCTMTVFYLVFVEDGDKQNNAARSQLPKCPTQGRIPSFLPQPPG